MRIRAVTWEPTSRYAQVITIATAAVLFAMLGGGLRWEPQYIVVGAVAFVVATWLTGSIVRALACVLGAVGVVAALVATAVVIDQGLLASMGVRWSWFAYAWWAVIVALAVAWRAVTPNRDFGIAELIGALASLAIAMFLAFKIDYGMNLLVYLVQVEDNEAWVGLLTLISQSPALGPGFEQHVDARGPIIAMILGLLGHFQRSGVAGYNAAFSAWALAVVLTPLAAASLLRTNRVRNSVVLAIFALITIGVALRLPLLLFASYGHLTATWAFLALLVSLAVLTVDGVRPWLTPVLGGLPNPRPVVAVRARRHRVHRARFRWRLLPQGRHRLWADQGAVHRGLRHRRAGCRLRGALPHASASGARDCNRAGSGEFHLRRHGERAGSLMAWRSDGSRVAACPSGDQAGTW
jgi:hypothetical protein